MVGMRVARTETASSGIAPRKPARRDKIFPVISWMSIPRLLEGGSSVARLSCWCGEFIDLLVGSISKSHSDMLNGFIRLPFQQVCLCKIGFQWAELDTSLWNDSLIAHWFREFLHRFSYRVGGELHPSIWFQKIINPPSSGCWRVDLIFSEGFVRHGTLNIGLLME